MGGDLFELLRLFRLNGLQPFHRSFLFSRRAFLLRLQKLCLGLLQAVRPLTWHPGLLMSVCDPGDTKAVIRHPRARSPAWRGQGKFQRVSVSCMKKLLTLSVAFLAGAALSAAAADAKAIYDKNCAKCHGADGKGDTKMGKKLGCKDYSDAKVQAEMKDEAATKAIKEGVNDKDGKILMKPAEGLSDADVKDLVAYMRTLKK